MIVELFGMIFEGGPYEAPYLAPQKLTWPLPDKVKALDHPEGHYRKYFESKGPAKDSEVRGARYKWVEEPY